MTDVPVDTKSKSRIPRWERWKRRISSGGELPLNELELSTSSSVDYARERKKSWMERKARRCSVPVTDVELLRQQQDMIHLEREATLVGAIHNLDDDDDDDEDDGEGGRRRRKSNIGRKSTFVIRKSRRNRCFSCASDYIKCRQSHRQEEDATPTPKRAKTKTKESSLTRINAPTASSLEKRHMKSAVSANKSFSAKQPKWQRSGGKCLSTSDSESGIGSLEINKKQQKLSKKYSSSRKNKSNKSSMRDTLAESDHSELSSTIDISFASTCKNISSIASSKDDTSPNSSYVEDMTRNESRSGSRGALRATNENPGGKGADIPSYIHADNSESELDRSKTYTVETISRRRHGRDSFTATKPTNQSVSRLRPAAGARAEKKLLAHSHSTRHRNRTPKSNIPTPSNKSGLQYLNERKRISSLRNSVDKKKTINPIRKTVLAVPNIGTISNRSKISLERTIPSFISSDVIVTHMTDTVGKTQIRSKRPKEYSSLLSGEPNSSDTKSSTKNDKQRIPTNDKSCSSGTSSIPNNTKNDTPTNTENNSSGTTTTMSNSAKNEKQRAWVASESSSANILDRKINDREMVKCPSFISSETELTGLTGRSSQSEKRRRAKIRQTLNNNSKERKKRREGGEVSGSGVSGSGNNRRESPLKRTSLINTSVENDNYGIARRSLKSMVKRSSTPVPSFIIPNETQIEEKCDETTHHHTLASSGGNSENPTHLDLMIPDLIPLSPVNSHKALSTNSHDDSAKKNPNSSAGLSIEDLKGSYNSHKLNGTRSNTDYDKNNSKSSGNDEISIKTLKQFKVVQTVKLSLPCNEPLRASSNSSHSSNKPSRNSSHSTDSENSARSSRSDRMQTRTQTEKLSIVEKTVKHRSNSHKNEEDTNTTAANQGAVENAFSDKSLFLSSQSEVTSKFDQDILNKNTLSEQSENLPSVDQNEVSNLSLPGYSVNVLPTGCNDVTSPPTFDDVINVHKLIEKDCEEDILKMMDFYSRKYIQGYTGALANKKEYGLAGIDGIKIYCKDASAGDDTLDDNKMVEVDMNISNHGITKSIFSQNNNKKFSIKMEDFEKLLIELQSYNKNFVNLGTESESKIHASRLEIELIELRNFNYRVLEELHNTNRNLRLAKEEKKVLEQKYETIYQALIAFEETLKPILKDYSVSIPSLSVHKNFSRYT